MDKKSVKRIERLLGAKSFDPVQLAAKHLELVNEHAAYKKKMLEMRQELDSLHELISRQHERSRHADLLWREAHGQPDCMPDLGDLLEWLIDRGDRWQAVVRAARDLDKNFSGYGDIDARLAKRSEAVSALHKAIERYDEFWNGAKF